MDDHKRALLEAWWSNVPDPEAPIQVPTVDLIGGARSRARVLAFLKGEKKLAYLELEAAKERERGREWWSEFFEEPADAELRLTLRMAVHRRPNESPEEYDRRLNKVAAALRARLPDYIREPERSAEA